MNELITYLQSISLPYETDVELKQKTWIHRGGVVKLWATPNTLEQLKEIGIWLFKHGMGFKVVGHTSNIYFLNTHNEDIIISTIKLTNFEEKDDEIISDCGVAIKKLAKYAVEQGYEGYEGLIDLPGTVAAACCNNSGCYNCTISSLINYIEILLPSGKTKRLAASDMHYSERSSAIKEGLINGVILSISLKKETSGNSISYLKNKAQQNHIHRLQYQEKPTQTLGSIFPLSVYLQFEKNLPLPAKCCIYVLEIAKKTSIINHLIYTKYKRDIILLTNGLWQLRPYISPYTFNCFIWKDEDADKAFEIYKNFVFKLSKSTITEIEIIK